MMSEKTAFDFLLNNDGSHFFILTAINLMILTSTIPNAP